MTPWKRLSQAAWLSLAAHLLASLAMLLILDRGLQTNPDLADRLDFVAYHRGLWSLAWLSWTLAGASILYFYASFAKAHVVALGNFARAALGLTALAIGCDWTAQAMEVFILPGLAETGGTASFLIMHRKAVLLTGGLANGLYTLAAALLLWPTRQAYPRWTVRAGWGVVLFGMALSAASAANSTAGLFWTNAGLVPCLIGWLAGTALYSGRY